MTMNTTPTINHMPSLARLAHRVTVTGKQPGRRFGPPPGRRTGVRGPRLLVHGLSAHVREQGYRAQTGRRLMLMVPASLDLTTPQAYALVNGLTPRQRRRSQHKGSVAR